MLTQRHEEKVHESNDVKDIGYDKDVVDQLTKWNYDRNLCMMASKLVPNRKNIDQVLEKLYELIDAQENELMDKQLNDLNDIAENEENQNPNVQASQNTQNVKKPLKQTKELESKQDEKPLVLGLDCSTQSLTVTIYDTVKFEEQYSVNINFDEALGEKYKTDHGVHQKGEEVTFPCAMFVEALDLALDKLLADAVPFDRIVSISGSAQQHGSIFMTKVAEARLRETDSSKTLYDNYFCYVDENVHDPFLAMSEGISWIDSSTTKQCRELEAKVGSALKLAEISGSRAIERFTGNQIAKVYQTHPYLYTKKVDRIALISSFMCSIFLGQHAAIDMCDGSGMNVLDIKQHKYDDQLLKYTAPNLKEKLGTKPVNSYNVLGNICNYFVARFGFNKDCRIVAFSGDNPCSLAGLMVCEEGDICISLGTSDTLFAVTSKAVAATEGHLFCSPIHEQAYMILIAFKNGSIPRETMRDLYCKDKSWLQFNQHLLDDAANGGAGNDGRIGFYYDSAEILPTVKSGFYRFDANDEAVDKYANGAQDIRAVVEGQFIAMKQYMQQFGINKFRKILATGGASMNPALLQVIADVFGASVYRSKSGPDTATKGAALRGFHGYICEKEGKFVDFSEVVARIGGANYIKVNEPNLKNYKIYNHLLERRKKLEETLPRL